MSEMTKYIFFKLNDQLFGVNVAQVISIERLQTITPIPRTSEFIKGVTELRGETTPILDLRERLKLPEAEVTDDTRILVIHTQGMQIGLIVDAATEVKDIADDQIQVPPKIIGGVKETFLDGVVKIDEELLVILNLDQVINLEEKNELLYTLEE